MSFEIRKHGICKMIKVRARNTKETRWIGAITLNNIN